MPENYSQVNAVNSFDLNLAPLIKFYYYMNQVCNELSKVLWAYIHSFDRGRERLYAEYISIISLHFLLTINRRLYLPLSGVTGAPRPDSGRGGNKSLPWLAVSAYTRENLTQDVKKMTIDQPPGWRWADQLSRWEGEGRVDHASLSRKWHSWPHTQECKARYFSLVCSTVSSLQLRVVNDKNEQDFALFSDIWAKI